MRFKPSLLPLLTVLLGAGDVAALGLGPMTVHSRLGARFYAEVELLGVPTDGRAISECFRLTQPTDPETGIAALMRGQITIERQSGKPRLLIRSEQSINDPVLQVSVRAGCGAEVVRDYMLIIDPADAKAVKPPPAAAVTTVSGKPPVQPAATARPRAADDLYPERWQAGDGESAQSIARNLFPRQPSAQRRFLTALQASNPDIDFGANGDAPLAAGTSFNIPDTRRRPAGGAAKTDQPIALEAAPARPKKERYPPSPARAGSGRMADRLSISGNADDDAPADGLPLRLATGLSSRASAGTTENGRAILRLEYKLLRALYDQAGEQLSLAEQVRQLEASAAELQAAAENGARPVPPPEVGISVAPATVPQEIAAPQAARRVRLEATDNTSAWLALGGLLGAVALVVWFLRRHARQAPRAPLGLAPENPPATEKEAAEEALPWSMADDPTRMANATGEQPSHETLLLDAGPEPQSQPVRPPEQAIPPESTALTEHAEFNPVMELADIMLSFGRVKGATEALLEYIESSPNEALQPWLKLLDIYRQGGMREEYEGLSQKLKFHFNVAPSDWEATAGIKLQHPTLGDEESAPLETLLSRLPNVGQIAHVRDEITRTWDRREGLAYLNKLLHDNRKGERQGFALPTVSELLFLLDVLDRRLKTAKTPA